MKILFSSDIHGNEQHLKALRSVVDEVKPDVFIYLGDISPNRFMYEDFEEADEYNLKHFFPVIESLPVEQKYVMPGNTDFHESKKLYEATFTNPAKCKFVETGVLPLNSKIDALFYHYTRFSPHSMKDGEEFDLSKLKHLHEETTKRTVTELIESENSMSEESDNVSESRFSIEQKQRAGSFMPQSCMMKMLAQAAANELSDLTESEDNIHTGINEEEQLFLEHQKIESRARVKYVKTEKICTSGVVSGEYSVNFKEESFIMSDALIYDHRYYRKVDIFDKSTEPEWFRRELQHTIEQNMRFLVSGVRHRSDAKALRNTNIKIWALHGPISNTVADRLRSGDHVGSKGARMVMEEYPPELIVSGHIHETCRDGRYKCYETNQGRETCIVAVGNEALVMPFCKKAAFVIIDVEPETGAVLKTQRVLRDVEAYVDAKEAFERFKQVSERLHQMSPQSEK